MWSTSTPKAGVKRQGVKLHKHAGIVGMAAVVGLVALTPLYAAASLSTWWQWLRGEDTSALSPPRKRASAYTDDEKYAMLPAILREYKRPYCTKNEDAYRVLLTYVFDEDWRGCVTALHQVAQSCESKGDLDTALVGYWRAGVEKWHPASVLAVKNLLRHNHFGGFEKNHVILEDLSHYPVTEELLKERLELIYHIEASNRRARAASGAATPPQTPPLSPDDVELEEADTGEEAPATGPQGAGELRRRAKPVSSENGDPAKLVKALDEAA